MVFLILSYYLYAHRSTISDAVDEYVGYRWHNWEEERDYPRCDETRVFEELPLSSVFAPVLGACAYFLMCYYGPKWMSSRKAWNLKWALVVHNLLLSLGSVLLTLAFLYTVSETVLHHRNETGSWWKGIKSVYNDPRWVMPCSTIFWPFYIFYVSKYYELLDTLFLILRKKPVRPVQICHHSRFHSAWMVAFVNSFVHIFVYGFFLASSLKLPFPWKNQLTVLQISQFIFDVLFAVPWILFKHNILSDELHHGDTAPWVLGNVIGLVFIKLFYDVYVENRTKARNRTAKKTKKTQ